MKNAFILLCLMMLIGCGQSGRLYLPTEPATTTPAAAGEDTKHDNHLL